VLDHTLGELLARVIGHVFLEERSQEIAAAADREADREGELVAKGAVVHGGGCSCSALSRDRLPARALSLRTRG
jgi:hypothetical protein